MSSSSSSSIAVSSEDGSGCFNGLLLLILLLAIGWEAFAWAGELPATEVEGVRKVEAGEDLGWEDFGWDGLGPGLGVPKKAARVACLALGMGERHRESGPKRPYQERRLTAWRAALPWRLNGGSYDCSTDGFSREMVRR